MTEKETKTYPGIKHELERALKDSISAEDYKELREAIMIKYRARLERRLSQIALQAAAWSTADDQITDGIVDGEVEPLEIRLTAPGLLFNYLKGEKTDD